MLVRLLLSYMTEALAASNETTRATMVGESNGYAKPAFANGCDGEISLINN